MAKRFLVETGDEWLIVEATDHEDAAVQACAQWALEEPPPSLGLLCLIVEVAESDVSFFATATACKRAGVWGEPTATA
jgi:hypothetical protein